MKVLNFIVLAFTTIAILAGVGHFLFSFLKETSLFIGNEITLAVLITAILSPIAVILIKWDYKSE